jgi:predicted Zn-dependent protease
LVFLLETKAQLLLAAGDVAGARTAATAATAADRNSLEAWLVLAEAELAAGRAEAVDRAIREMERISADAIVIERRATERRSSIESGLAKLRAERERA